MDDRQHLLDQLAAQEALIAELRQRLAAQNAQIAAQDARIAELEEELRRRGHRFHPKPNGAEKAAARHDRRRKKHRKHPGSFRPMPAVTRETIHHDVHVERCTHCGSRNLTATNRYDDHLVEDLPEPKIEVHRYRRHEYACKDCHELSQGYDPLEIPGSLVGPRVRLFNIYARAALGISLEKTCDCLDQFFGLKLSRAGALGHLRWGSRLFAPVVEQLLHELRRADLVHADETGWRIDGRNVWAWSFSNPRLAVLLIRASRSAAVVREVLGDSFAGVLVSDFYAAYHALDCRKQRCLVHLLRELVRLRETLHPHTVRSFIQPMIELLQKAIALGGQREKLSPDVFRRRAEQAEEAFWAFLASKRTLQDDCQRLTDRCVRHADELFLFLQVPGVPSDNNAGERDIRSVAAIRADGGVNRTAWGAEAFARAKSVLRTCQKNSRRFLDYGLSLLCACRSRRPLPLPFNTS